MSNSDKVKFVHDVDAQEAEFQARKPFKVEKEENRRFVRLEISSPMSMQRIKDAGGDFSPEGDWHTLHAMILNISAGGVLVELDQPLREGDIVSMHFTLQEIESLDHILGLVKRAEQNEGFFMAGIEFVSREHLNDILSQGEIDLLPDTMASFTESVRDVLNRYIFRERIASQPE